MSAQSDIVQRIATKAVIVRHGKALILRENSAYDEGTKGGKWQLPGGRLNPGESISNGLLREVSEETGLTVEIDEIIHYGEWSPVIRGVPHQIIGIFFVCNVIAGEILLSAEHDAFDWVDEAQLAARECIEPDRSAMLRYFDMKEG